MSGTTPAQIAQAERKARGAFFTPPEIADFIASWAIESPSATVLEPSCGEAEFLLAAARRLDDVGGGERASEQLHGVELHEASAQRAILLLAEAGLHASVEAKDFFDFDPGQRYSAVIGNPPYVRFQEFTGTARAASRRAALRQGVNLSGLASSWAAFTVKAAGHVSPGGKLGLVLPAEILSVNYAKPVREFLLKRFASVKLVMFDERVFADALADTVLLLASGDGPADSIDIQSTRNLASINASRTVSWRPPSTGAKWTPALLDSDVSALFAEITATDSWVGLSDWGKPVLGAVTGNNKFFCVSESEAQLHELTGSDLVRISPPGSGHLRSLNFGGKYWDELRNADRKVFMVNPAAKVPSPGLKRYLKLGEESGVPDGYKCRRRNPWWAVPTVAKPDLFLTYMNHHAPQLCSNDAGVLHLNSVHGVRLNSGLKQIGRELLPLVALNSVTLLGAELVGRSYGGGILKIEPREAADLPVTSHAQITQAAESLRAIRPHLSTHLRKGDVEAATKLVDQVLLVESLGISRSTVGHIRAARSQLLARRLARGS